MASGWMRVRARARQRGAELPLILSDHADWDELTQTLREVGAPEVWVTHGNEEALVHYANSIGLRGRALAPIGRGEEEQEDGGQIGRASCRARGWRSGSIPGVAVSLKQKKQ